MERIRASTSNILFAEPGEMMDDPTNGQQDFEAAYERLIAADMAFHAKDTSGLGWSEIDTHQDYKFASGLFG